MTRILWILTADAALMFGGIFGIGVFWDIREFTGYVLCLFLGTVILITRGDLLGMNGPIIRAPKDQDFDEGGVE